MKVLGIYRERIFSPGKVDADAAILDTVLGIMYHRGHDTLELPAESVMDALERADLILSMAQWEPVLRILERAERNGCTVVNAVSAVRNCYREAMVRIFARARIPVPVGRVETVSAVEAWETFGRRGDYWLKRGDFHALGPGDVVKIGSCAEWSEALAHFRREGVDHILIQEHVEGPCVKFYGVGVDSDGFFRAFLSASGEEITSRAGELPETARAAARCTGLEVYGGDAILTPDHAWVIVDLNDWPSFSLCLGPAAGAIVEYLEGINAIKGVSNGIS